jgi:MFS transporter, DHA1 family, tetracycline resistance protein
VRSAGRLTVLRRADARLVFVLCTVFLDVVGVGLLVPMLPFYAVSFGADGLEVGLLFATYSLAMFLATPGMGVVSDRVGRRPVLLCSLIGLGIGYVVLGTAGNLFTVFLARAICGLTAGNIGAVSAAIADISTDEDRTRRYALLGAVYGVGYMIGPALGGALSVADLRAPAFAAAALTVVNLVFGFAFFPESLARVRRSTAIHGQQLAPFVVLFDLLRRADIRAPLLAGFLFFLSFQGFQSNFALFFNARFGFGPPDIARLYVAVAGTRIAAQLIVVPRLSVRLRDVTIVTAGLALAGIAYLSCGLTPFDALLWISMPTLSVGYALAQAPLLSLCTKLVAPDEFGRVSGGVQALTALGGATGPFLAGAVYDHVALNAPYILAAMLMGLAILILMPRVAPEGVSWLRPAT